MKKASTVSIRASAKLLAALACLAPATTYAAAVSWDGGGADNNWSTALNWSNDLVPAAIDDLTFGDVDKTTSSTPNSIVTASISVRDLNFTNTGGTASDWHYIQIDSGQTLTVTRAFVLAGANNVATNVKFSGAGTLSVGNGTSSAFTVRGPTGGTNTAYATPSLDLSGLSAFNANVGAFAVGSNGIGLATVNLAASNSITATSLTIGTNQKNTSTGTGGNSVLNLGAANTLNVDAIAVGNTNSRTGGVMQFAATGGSVTIRGAAGGTSRASMIIGQGGDGTGATTSSATFTGSTIDARFSDLIVGSSSVGNTAAITGNFSMDAGTVDATAVTVGRRTGSGSGLAVGNLNIAGGSFQAGAMTVASNANTNASTATGVVNISGTANVQVGTSGSPANLVMGVVTGTVNLTSNATVNVTGGTLTVHGNIAEGANAGIGTVTSTLNLAGGTLDLTGHGITVDTFSVQSGTLKNLGQFNSGADVVKTTAGALILDGANTFTGDLNIAAGSVTLANTGSITFYIGENGVNNAITGLGTASFEGTFVFDLSGASLVEGNSWLITDVASQSFAGSFGVNGFTQQGDIWTNGLGFTFSEATGVLSFAAVPEPSSAAALAGLGVIGLAAFRRRRRA